MPGGSKAQDQTSTTRADRAPGATQRDRPSDVGPGWVQSLRGRPLGPHPFAPLTFHDADGKDPIQTDWCGHMHGGLFGEDELDVCRQLVDADVHRVELDLVDQAVDAIPDTGVEDRLHDLLRAEGYVCPDHPEATS